MYYFLILYRIYLDGQVNQHTYRHTGHALITLLGMWGKARTLNQKSSSECQFSIKFLIILILATRFLYFSDERNELNSLMPSIMQLNKLEAHLQYSFGLKTLLKMCHIKSSNWAIGRALCHSEVTSETSQVAKILSLKVDSADLGERQGRGY